MIRSVIIDDEFLARERLKKLLLEHPDIHLVGEAKNGKEGLALIASKSPDLVFLDIEMPDLDGFSVMSQLKQSPMIVFTTAYANYAVKAFEVQAVDYLLKPFDDERLDACVSGIRKKIQTKKSAELGLQMERLVKSYAADDSKYRQSFQIKEKGYVREVFADDVILMEADSNYVRLLTPEKTYLYRISMNNLESDLNPSHFVRIHRAMIVNKHAVQSHTYLGNNEYEFLMKNGRKVSSSRRYKVAIQRNFYSESKG